MKRLMLSSLLYFTLLTQTSTLVNSCVPVQKYASNLSIPNKIVDSYFSEGRDSILTAQLQIYKVKLDLKNEEQTKIFYDCKTNEVDRVTIFEDGTKKTFFSSDTLENAVSKKVILKSHEFIYDFFGIKKEDEPTVKLFKLLPSMRGIPKSKENTPLKKYEYNFKKT